MSNPTRDMLKSVTGALSDSGVAIGEFQVLAVSQALMARGWLPPHVTQTLADRTGGQIRISRWDTLVSRPPVRIEMWSDPISGDLVVTYIPDPSA